MKIQNLTEIDSDYDVSSILRFAKRKVIFSSVYLSLSASVSLLSVFAIVFLGENPLIFIASAALLIISVIALIKLISSKSIISMSGAIGNIINVNISANGKRTIVSGIGLFRRQYDSYIVDCTTCTLFIQDDKEIKTFELSNITKKHSEYYNVGDKVMRIPFTRFPVKIHNENKTWLCPVCGAFNSKEEKCCPLCKCKIRK